MIAWRRRALDQQLPAAAFPAGSGAPSLVYLWVTMLVAAAAVLGFAVHDQRGVPTAVRDSQRDLVLKVSRSINANMTHAVTELDELIGNLARQPLPADADVLSRVVGTYETWAGAAIAQTATRQVVANVGAAIPLDSLPTPLPTNATIVVTTPDGPALVHTVALDGARTVVAIQPVLMRNLRLNPEARHGVFMITPDGKTTLMQGVSAVEDRLHPSVFKDLSTLESSTSRVIAVKEWQAQQLVISAAPIGDTGIVIAFMIVANVADGTSGLRGLLLGSSLLVVAILSFMLMRASLVRPLRALLRQAKADACGMETNDRRLLRIAEAYRIAHALAVSSGAGLRSTRWRPTAWQGLLLASVVGLLWPTAAALTVMDVPDAAIPAQLVFDEESRAEATSTVLGNALDSGLGTVADISAANEKADPATIEPALKRGLEEDHRLRGMYLVDPKGKIVKSVGRRPLRPHAPLPGTAGIRLDATIDRLPVIYAYRTTQNGFAVVGEFDIDYLLKVVRQVDGRVRVVDPELRTVLDSEGYRAFQELSGATARDVAISALPGGTIGRSHTTDGEPTLMAGTGLVTPSVAHLEWVVVVERDIGTLQLPEIVTRRWTLLVAGGMVGIIALTLAWHLLVFIRPLRRLATEADRIRSGNFDEAVTPQRHDDIGAIAMCLEICRQVRHTGSARFGGAIRLRGSEENFTYVLPRVPRQTRHERTARI